jgi:uncharacterized protein
MEPWSDVLLFGITLFAMLIGLFLTLIPMVPGVVIIWLAALIYGIISGFNLFGVIMFIVITLLMIASVILDEVLMGAGARKGGASWWTVIAAIIAGILGTLLFPPFGGLIAAPLAVLLIEYWRGKDLQKAGSAIKGLAIGWGLSYAAKFVIGIVMISFWGFWALMR